MTAAEARLEQARVLAGQGDIAAALAAIDDALALDGGLADAEAMRGQLFSIIGQHALGVEAYRRALVLAPSRYDILVNYAGALRSGGNDEEAFAVLSRATEQEPTRHEAWFNLGNLARDTGLGDEAARFYDEAAALCGGAPTMLDALAVAYLGIDRPERARDCLRAALASQPRDATLLVRLGIALRRMDEPTEAIACLEAALRLRPDDIRIRNEYANALKQSGAIEVALAEYDQVLAAVPDDAATRWNRALALLACGRLAEGWDEYRWGWPSGKRQPWREHPQAPWRGETAGRVLLWGEQGVGDEILFASVLPDAIARAEEVVVECDQRLVKLFARSFPAAEIVPRSAPPDGRTRAAGLAHQASLADLPGLFRRRLVDFPGTAYLRADPIAVEHWRRRLDQLAPGRKVGLSWRSGLTSGLRDAHYMRPEDFTSLLSTPGIVFVNLQYDECEAELACMETLGARIVRFPELDLMNDFDGVAALLMALDAVIVPGNAVCALAGALGVTTWRFAVGNRPYVELGTGRLPWFTGVEVLHRRPEEGWGDVVRNLTDRLSDLVGE